MSTVQYDTTHRSNSMSDLVTALGSTGYVQLWTGSLPANCASAPTGTMVGALAMSSTAGTVSSGELTFNPISSGSAIASGSMGYYRLCTTSGAVSAVSQGDVGVNGSGAALTFSGSVAVATGQPLSISAWTITAFGA